MPRVQLPRWTGWAAPPALLMAGGVAWLLYRIDPSSAASPFPPCAFRALTGFYCVGCGGTRCAHALLHADIPTAWAMNPLLVVLLALVPFIGAWLLGYQPRWLRPLIQLLQAPAFWLTLLPLYWVARNLPWPPFTALAPLG
ncbi:MAG: hypothetical protein GAK31_02596 [Stenotrophomonas maltophilia]|uniref:DUF2752 domain-containing protein n=1 Tax=Stenotrophomonas maltophilia TaxID=40324 RepID=A0A7V8JLG7_STEMA|nr:MAG: hypothetical protein GAK31_02596 [Stenotrophomonas maltophilia]